MYGHGISQEGDLVDLGLRGGIVEKSGAWFAFKGERIGQGRENAKEFMIDHPDVYSAVEAKLLAHHNVRRIGIDVAPVEPVEVDKDEKDKSDKAEAKPAKPAAAAAAPAAGAARPGPATPAPTNGRRN